jgi:hypothetical protein
LRKRHGKTDKERAQTQEEKKKDSQKKQNEAKSTFFASPPPRECQQGWKASLQQKSLEESKQCLAWNIARRGLGSARIWILFSMAWCQGRAKDWQECNPTAWLQQGNQWCWEWTKTMFNNLRHLACTGVETSCTLLAERQHWHKQRMSENYPVEFPKIGHYDTWKIDVLQLIVEKKHGKWLYP